MRFTSLILACIVLTFGIPCFANETPVSFILSPLDKLDTPTEPEVNVILTMDWKETLLSLYVFDPCANAVVLESVTVTDAPTALDAADGVLSIVVSTGTAIELHLEGRNGASDYDFSLPGVIDGIAPGHYKATVEDAGGCISEPLMVIVPYAQCCAGCGHHDVDVDGICDDSDECTNRRASNYADPSNVACIIPGCMDPDFVEYYSEATVDNGSCSTAVVNGCTDPVYSEYDSAANTDDGSCQSLLGCSDSDVSSMDGYSYGLVTIGDQCWFSENLRTTVYADGSAIPEVSDDTAWAGLSTGARCDYDNDASNVATYGRLYNWHAATASAELCPSGWHVPTDDEWTALEDYLGANGHSGAEGTALKSTSGWFDGGNGTDDFGFSALSGGYRLDYNGDFDNAGDLSFWWSSSPDGGSAWLRYLSYYDADINRAVTNPMAGYSVRCLRDADFTEVQGCTNPAYDEYDSAANSDDGSCQTLLGCSDSDVSSMDGYSYGLVTIGDQCWFSENLRTTVYADGSAIPEVTDDGAWSGLSTGARCDYDNDASNVATYGRLYNWHAATDVAELCPSGWHVPTDGEWTELEDYLGANGHSGDEGTALRSTSGWNSGGNGTDDFGFSALPGGYRSANSGNFYDAGFYGYWWSSSPSGGDAWFRYLDLYYPGIYRVNSVPRYGFSVRCLRDADFTEVQGCTDPDYEEFNPSANADDGSCQTLASNCDSPSMDGYSYAVVEIGDQCWFAENLRTSVYADGSGIPEVTDDGAWSGLSTGARCDYDNDANNVATYGRLYNWYAVNNGSGLCPSGWHVPTDGETEGELKDLVDYITSQGFGGTEGTALKSTSGWDSGGNGTDDFGFSALPGGYRSHYNSNFTTAGWIGKWWSSSPYDGDRAVLRSMRHIDSYINQYANGQGDGFSVRCLRDADFTEVQGCTNPAYAEFNPSANADDGSCTTLILEGCTDPAYDEYDSAANSDDGSCQSLLGCTDSDVSSMDGYSYGLVTIGDQCWFSENLRTTVYADGSAIPEVTDDGAWSGLSTGARCDYDNDASNVATYGRLYNWHAATDVAELCPSGWHVPTDGEWTELEDYLGANGHSGDEGTALRSTSGWNSGGNGTDDFGFSALPGGYRDYGDGSFGNAGYVGFWWSSSPSGGVAWHRNLLFNAPAIYRYNGGPRDGFSVRCLRDAD